MKNNKKLTALTLSFVMAFTTLNCSPVDAATAKGTTLRLEATEGTVTLSNAQGKDKSIKDGMKLYKGDVASTAAKSYAYISLDSTKAVKMDENSAVSIKQNGTENEVFLSEGNLLFNVTVPLKKKESLNIRTSTMVTGVRGTIGVGKRISDDESVLYLLEGHTDIRYIDNKTKKVKTVSVAAGEQLDVKRVKGKQNNDNIASKALLSKITEEDIDDFAVIEIGRNLDIQNRLRKGGIFDVDKILQRYRRLGDNGKYITLGGRGSTGTGSDNTGNSGNAVTGNAVTGNTVSPNKTEDTGTGGTGGGGSGGGSGGGGGGSAPAGNGGNNPGQNNENGGNENAGNENQGNENPDPNAANNANAPTVTMQSTYTPSSSYAINSVIPALGVNVDVTGGTADVTYQWYRSETAGELGGAIEGETNASYTPPSDTLGTTYYTCVATIKTDDADPSEKESEQYRITILKKNNISNISAPAAPDYENIGFNYVTIPEVTTYTPAAVSVREGIDKDNGTIRLQSANPYGLIKSTLVFDDPGSSELATIPEGSVIEYACVTSNQAPADDGAWQTGRTFENLEAATTYYCFSRAGATDDTAASDPSAALEIATKGCEEVDYCTDDHFEYRIVSSNGVYTAACGFEYHPDKTGAGNKYFNYDGTYEIPASISCYGLDIPVTEIFEKGFCGVTGESHYNSFYGSIVLPDSIKVIGDQAFDSIIASDGIKLGAGIEIIGDSAFRNAYIIFDAFPQGVKEIGNSAFSGCGIYSLTLPEGLEKLGDGAFMNCDSLRIIKLPKSLTSVGNGVFLNCNNLNDVTLPEGLTAVSSNAFMNCQSLSSIELPSTVTEIGYQAFYGCKYLGSINIPDGVTYIGKSAFYNCESLTRIDLPDSVEYIGPQAFAYCKMLVEITIPEGVTTLDYWTFRNCTVIERVYLPASLEKILMVDDNRVPNRFPFMDCNEALVIYYPGSSIPDGFSEGWSRLSAEDETKTVTVNLNYNPGS